MSSEEELQQEIDLMWARESWSLSRLHVGPAAVYRRIAERLLKLKEATNE